MKFTHNWLKEHLDTIATPQEIADKLTAIGLEVDAFTDMGKKYAPFIIAEITEAAKHPNADKLQVCKVNNGSEVLQIVCGAANARAGIKVVLAPVGAMIPNGNFQIKKSKIRDVESNGMLCSGEELELSGNSDGIIELGSDAPVGGAYAEYAGMNDSLYEINITPNRADCLGVYGIARDLAAAGMGKLKPLKTQSAIGNQQSAIKVSSPSHYIGCYISGVSNGKNDFTGGKLKAIGQTPISTLVDITNYVTFDLGRPLHVYDADKLSGNITVREAKKGEKINALNNKTYEMAGGELVVADDKGIIALAGVIGNVESSVTAETKNIFLEVAYFDPAKVAESGRRHQIDSDARYRFERGVDPEFVATGADIAVDLITQLCGGVPSQFATAHPAPDAGSPGKTPDQVRGVRRSIEFDFAKVKSFGGIDIARADAEKILKGLGFTISSLRGVQSDGALITPPSWRGDVEGSADIVEEILRIHGYDKVPAQALAYKSSGKPPAAGLAFYLARKVLAARGLMQVVTYSFMKPQIAAKFGGGAATLQLQNPISVELSEMRPSLIPNLLEAVVKNSNRGFKNLGLFETGPVFGEKEQKVIAGIRSGKNAEKNIYGDSRNVDVFDAKADLLNVLEAIGAPQGQIVAQAPSYYHPGKSGGLYLGKTCLGYFGEIHPKILKALDISLPVSGFEIFVDNIPESKKKYKQLEVSDLQEVARDFAFLLNKDVSADALLAVVKKSDPLIGSTEVFDVYSGDKIAPGKKSVAFSININPKDKTLTDKEIEAISAKVIDNVREKFSAELRA